MFFQDPNLPELGKTRRHYSNNWTTEALVKMQDAQKLARQNSALARAKEKADYDSRKRSAEKDFQVGDQILVHFPRNSINPREKNNPKFEQPWQGPFIITKALGNYAFQTLNQSTRRTTTTHANRMKLYLPGAPPTADTAAVKRHVQTPAPQQTMRSTFLVGGQIPVGRRRLHVAPTPPIGRPQAPQPVRQMATPASPPLPVARTPSPPARPIQPPSVAPAVRHKIPALPAKLPRPKAPHPVPAKKSSLAAKIVRVAANLNPALTAATAQKQIASGKLRPFIRPNYKQ
jgi:hypothetical protein